MSKINDVRFGEYTCPKCHRTYSGIDCPYCDKRYNVVHGQ